MPLTVCVCVCMCVHMCVHMCACACVRVPGAGGAQLMQPSPGGVRSTNFAAVSVTRPSGRGSRGAGPAQTQGVKTTPQPPPRDGGTGLGAVLLPGGGAGGGGAPSLPCSDSPGVPGRDAGGQDQPVEKWMEKFWGSSLFSMG